MAFVLHYFEYSGRGELLRLIAEEGKINMKQNIVPLPLFWQIRDGYPYGQLPMITQEDSDFELAQSNAIARLFGKLCNMYPTDVYEAAQVDAIVDAVSDYRGKSYTAYFTSGEQEQQTAFKNYRDVNLKYILTRFETMLNKKKKDSTEHDTIYFVGDKITIADICVFDYMEENAPFINFNDDIPTLLAFRDGIASRPNIAAYINSERRSPNQLGTFKLIE
jgi:glutathione S-transferase